MEWVNLDKFHHTDDSALRLIHTKNLYSDGDELRVVDCIVTDRLIPKATKFLSDVFFFFLSSFFLCSAGPS